MKHLIATATLLLATLFPPVASAGVYACQPEGMSDAEAERITTIATELGESFRDTINEARSNGVTLRNDTTLADILADPERALELAKERNGRRGVQNSSVQHRLERGDELDDILRDIILSLVNSNNTNYISIPLDEHLNKLALAVGGLPTGVPSEFTMNPNIFVFAFGEFAKAAELNFSAPGLKRQILGRPTIRYSLFETWSLFRRERFLNQHLVLSSGMVGGTLSIDRVWLLEFSYLDSRFPPTIFEKNRCLTNFAQTE